MDSSPIRIGDDEENKTENHPPIFSEDLINFINSQVGGDRGDIEGIKIDKILNCRIDLAPK